MSDSGGAGRGLSGDGGGGGGAVRAGIQVRNRPQSYRLVAALTLADRLNARRAAQEESERTISCPEDIVDALGPVLGRADQEELHALYLNTRNRVVAHRMIYRGNVNSMAIRPAEVYRTAVVCNFPTWYWLTTTPAATRIPARRTPRRRGAQRGRQADGSEPARPHRNQPQEALGEHERARADGCVTGCNRL